MKALFIIFIIALVIYVGYYFVTTLDVTQWSILPSYLSPFGSRSTSTLFSPYRYSAPPPASPAPSPYVPAPSQVTPPQGFSTGDLSPFYGKVHLASVTPPSYVSGGGSFTIRMESSVTVPVDFAGWAVWGNKAKVVLEGVPPSMMIGPVNQSALLLRPGEELVVYGATSNYLAQIRNIRLNKCTGYLNETYRLEPKVPEQCPRRDRSEFMTFTGTCQTYLYSLNTCAVPTPAKMNELSYDAACRTFLDTLNYNACERSHRADADFFQTGWRVWLINSLPFDVNHDRLILLDAQGLVAGEYVY